MDNKYIRYLKSEEWAEVKIELLTQRGCKCERCGKETESLDVHHKTYKNLFNEEPEDLILLCRSCHNFEHGIGVKKKKKRKVKKKRNVLKYYEKLHNRKNK